MLCTDAEVTYMDCGDNVLLHLDMLTREIFLPLICSDTHHATRNGVSADKVMDILHRLMSQVETVQGHTEVKFKRYFVKAEQFSYVVCFPG